MVEYQNNQVVLPQENQNNERKQKRGFFFIEIGLFEIAFVVIILATIFGILNYFRILHISSVIPQISFLPVKATPTPIPLPQSQIESQIKNFATSVVQPNLLPKTGITSLPVKKTLRGFSLTWSASSKATIQILSSYDTYETQLQYSKAYVHIGLLEKNISSTSAQSVTNIFFKAQNPLSKWACLSKVDNKQGIFCTALSEIDEGKIGFTIVNTDASSSAIVILSCFVPKRSSLYNTTTSCISNGI